MSALRAVLDRLAARAYHPAPGVDTFAPPIEAAEAASLLAAVAAARFPEPEPPFTSPLPAPEARNDRVPARVLHEPKGERWVVLAPPYGSLTPTGDPGLYAMHAHRLARRGFGVALLPLPFHGQRGYPGRPSGWGFVRADLASTSRAIARAAADAAALARHLRDARGAGWVGGFGISLGGAAVGLAAALARGSFDALALLAAVDNPASFYYTGWRRAFRRVELAEHGYGENEVRRAFAPFAPSSHPAPFTGDRAIFAVPPLDGTVPARTQEAWRRAWRGERAAAWGHGHVSAIVDPFLAGRLARRLAAVAAARA